MKVRSAEKIQKFPSLAILLGSKTETGRLAETMGRDGFIVLAEEDLSKSFIGALSPDPVLALKQKIEYWLNQNRNKNPFDSIVLHPGVSHWVHRPGLHFLSQELNMDLIAPSAKMMSLFSNKLLLLNEAEKLGVRTLALGLEPIQSQREVEKVVKEFGLPLVLKSVIGVNPGVGVRVIHHAKELRQALPTWLELLYQSTGEAIYFAERYLEGARQILVPFARFSSRETILFSFLDVSLQNRTRKLVEMGPVRNLDPVAHEILRTQAQKMLNAINYVGVGNLEFLVDGPRVFLINAHPGLHPGYRLWEKLAETNAFEWQLASLFDLPKPSLLKAIDEEACVFGITAYIHADNGFRQLPQPGYILDVDMDSGRSMRTQVVSGVRTGFNIISSDTSLLGVVTTLGRSLKESLKSLNHFLDQCWVCGSLQSNESYLLQLLNHPWVQEGIFHAGFVEEDWVPNPENPIPKSHFLMVLFALDNKIAVFDKTWWIGGAKLNFKYIESDVTVQVATKKETKYGPAMVGKIKSAEGVYPCAVIPIAGQAYMVKIGHYSLVIRQFENTRYLYAQAGGRVLSCLIKNGSIVKARSPIVVLSSLEQLVPHALPIEAKLVRWLVEVDEEIDIGTPLCEVEILPKQGENV